MTAAWDDRLISRGEAADLAGLVPVSWDLIPGDGTGRLILRCLDHKVPQSCGQWTAGRRTNLDEMISGILRHLVMSHDLPLNRAARKETDGRLRNDPGAGEGAGGRAADPAGGRGLPGGPGPGPGPGHAD